MLFSLFFTTTSDLWSKFLVKEDISKVENGGKLLLLLEILDDCGTSGDKLLVCIAIFLILLKIF